MAQDVWLVERMRRDGSGGAVVGFAKNGDICYHETWREGAWFVRAEDAQRFALLAEKAGLKDFGILGRYEAREHSFG